MKKKILSVLLTAAMVTSILAGCGSSAAPAADTGAAADAGAAEEAAPAEEAAADDSAAADASTGEAAAARQRVRIPLRYGHGTQTSIFPL